MVRLVFVMMEDKLVFTPHTTIAMVETIQKSRLGNLTRERKPRREIEPDTLDEVGDDILPPSVAEKTNLYTDFDFFSF